MRPLGHAPAGRPRQVAVLYAATACLALLVGVQWILASVAIEGFQAGQRDVLVSSALASGLCCGAACWLARNVL